MAGGVLPNSVAVLPFENLSPAPENAYFAAGIHEEILNQLVKLRNLSVISRTSVVRHTDSDLSIPEIANELNVETVMEGSVRYAGERVRISAQLIDADTDEHLWSDVYGRDFSDVFAIQADIAMNIANALQARCRRAIVDIRHPIALASIAYANSRIGRNEDVLRVLGRLDGVTPDRQVDAGSWVLGYLAAGDEESA